jgi:hypothetical protein
MIPLFKSHYSIGKSILTLDPPKESRDGGADSVFDLATEAGLDQVVLIEDSFMGFLQANKVANSLGLKLLFGIRIDILPESIDEDDKSPPSHRIVLMAKNSSGCQLLYKIYSETQSGDHKGISLEDLDKHWNGDDLDFLVPFYDSFLFNNLFVFNSFVLDLSKYKPTFLIEDNGLPYDILLGKCVDKYCESNNFSSQKCKSIFYKSREDFDAFVTYKLICNRNSFSSRNSSLEKPNIDHMGSREFCFDSFLQHNE